MRNLLPVALLCALAASFSGASQAAPKAVQMEVTFGTTKYLPLTPAPKLAGDYVADAKTVVPDTVRKCGGTDVRYQPATDGAAAVVFSTTRPSWKIARCIKNLIPQVEVQSATSVEQPCPPFLAGYSSCRLIQVWP